MDSRADVEARGGDDAAASEALRLAKRELRARCRQVRDDLGPVYREGASLRICERIQPWDAFRSAGTVFAYLPMRGEVDLRPLITRAPGVRWAVPRIVRDPARRLAFHAYHPDRLILHRYGMLEPDPADPEIAPDQADVILVPGIAFSRGGYRIGYGGGYYDRLLAQAGQAPRLGVCYQALLLDALPHAPHDVPVSHLVTEALGVVACPAAA